MTFPGRGKPVAMGGVGRELPWQVTWRDGAVAIGKLPPMGAVDLEFGLLQHLHRSLSSLEHHVSQTQRVGTASWYGARASVLL